MCPKIYTKFQLSGVIQWPMQRVVILQGLQKNEETQVSDVRCDAMANAVCCHSPGATKKRRDSGLTP